MTAGRDKFVVAHDGARIAYEIRGRDEDETVVLLHSLGADKHMWDGCLESLERHHRVILVECRGHGASGPGSVTTVDQWVDDLWQVLRASDASEVTLVGISLGGIQALAFASAHPNMVVGLVVADSFVVLPRDIAHAKVRYLCDQVDTRPMAAVAEQYVAETFRQPYPVGAATVRHAIATMDPASYIAAVKVCFNVSIADRLQQIVAPTLVLWGEYDNKAPRGLSDQIVAGIRGARLAIVPLSGHLSNVDNPAGFAAEVTAFSARRNTSTIDPVLG